MSLQTLDCPSLQSEGLQVSGPFGPVSAHVQLQYAVHNDNTLSQQSSEVLRRSSDEDIPIISRGSKLDLMLSLYANNYRLAPRASASPVLAAAQPPGQGVAPAAEVQGWVGRLFSRGSSLSALSRAGSSGSFRRVSSGQQTALGTAQPPHQRSHRGGQHHSGAAHRSSSSSSEETNIVRRLQHRPLVMTTLFVTSLYRHLMKRSSEAATGTSFQRHSVDVSVASERAAGGQPRDSFMADLGDLVVSLDVPESGQQSLEASLKSSRPPHSVSPRSPQHPAPSVLHEYRHSGRLLTHPSEPVRHVHGSDGYARTVDNAEGNLIAHAGMIVLGWLEVVDLLGQGTFGQVFLCKDLRICDGAYRSPADYCPGEDFRYDYCTQAFCPNGDVGLVPTSPPLVAVKIIKSLRHFEQQFEMEMEMLTMLNVQRSGDDDTTDPSVDLQCMQAERGVGQDHRAEKICTMFAHGLAYGHRCVVLERLGPNLYDLITSNHNKGLSMRAIQSIGRQIVSGLSLMHRRCRIVHCDIKPENVLTLHPPADGHLPSSSTEHSAIKLIDFSSSCYHGQQTFTYLQSRYYRAPEVIIGAGYSFPIDMWSLGCLLAELFLGMPLLPGACDHQQLMRIEEMLDPLPDSLIEGASLRSTFYADACELASPCASSPGGSAASTSAFSGSFTPVKRFTLLSDVQFAHQQRVPVAPFVRYFQYKTLDRLVQCCPLSPEEQAAVQADPHSRPRLVEDVISWRKKLLDLLKGLLQVDPNKRLTVREALTHNFFT
jgi:serine/threonine protein kinase